MKSVFRGFNPDDNDSNSLPLQTGAHSAGSAIYRNADNPNSKDGKSTAISSAAIPISRLRLSDLDRTLKYQYYQEMIEEPIFDSAIDMHLSHALSLNPQTGTFLSIEATDPKFTKLAKELNVELGRTINESMYNWAKLSTIYGVHYIRPYAEQGKGITHIESGYHTLAVHIREYERSGMLAGFTSEHFKKEDSTSIELAEPWTLVGIKMPTWRPDINKEPENLSGTQYRLYDDSYHRTPIERQNYGVSMLHSAFEPWLDMKDALVSLRSSRNNASRIDRLVTVGMEGLTPQAAANQLNLVGAQLKGNIKSAEKKQKREGVMSSIFTYLLPSIAGGKNGISVDTHSINPDIQHIEDIMFHLKRAASALGIDVTLLGWGDMMSGGLGGEGGWFRTSIQAAIRANIIRIAVRNAVHRLIDIHLIYKTGKAFGTVDRPYEIKFHSLNTAIEQEQSEALMNRAEFATSVATLLDMVEQGTLNKSDTFKNMMMTDWLQMNEDQAEKIMSELKAGAKESDNNQMFESIQNLEQLAEQAAKNQFNKILMETE